MSTEWEKKEDLSWDNVLDKLSEIGPIFPCNADNIDILSSPTQFYESLIDNASRANDRIFISTLYIGQGEREHNLVSIIENSLKMNPDLEFSMIMDCSRATRNIHTKESSLHTLLPLFNRKNVNINLFRSPGLKGFWSLFPERSKEIAGVHHMKVFIFDDTLIMTGANLNETYLSNRQDRYFVFRDNERLTNHIYEMMQTLNNYCPNVAYNEEEKAFDIDMNINKKKYKLNDDQSASINIYDDIQINVEQEPSKWIDFVSKRLWRFTQPNECKQFDENDTFIVMSTQIMDKIESDCQMTSCLLSMPNVNMKIGTAYFNLAHKYNQILLNTYSNIYKHQRGKLQILTASEQCNSFYKARGLAGYVTPLYEYFAKQFENEIDAIHRQHNGDNAHLFEFHRYDRKDWTYHGKGIWIDFEEPFSLTMIGSSNYGERSVHKDTEMNFTILTKNESLRERLKQEWKNLKQHADEDSNNNAESTPYFVSLMSGLVKNFM